MVAAGAAALPKRPCMMSQVSWGVVAESEGTCRSVNGKAAARFQVIASIPMSIGVLAVIVFVPEEMS